MISGGGNGGWWWYNASAEVDGGCFATRVDIGTTWRRLLLHVEHDTADDLALREALVGPVYGETRSARQTPSNPKRKHVLRKRRQRLELVVALDLPARRNIKRLARVLAVTDVRAEDADALHDGEEDVRAEARARGEADDHERAAHAEVVDGLRVRLARRGGDDRRVRAEPVRRGDDVLHEVLRLPVRL